MTLDFHDSTGTHRTDTEIQDAIRAVELRLIGGPFDAFTVELPTIREGLRELLYYRGLIQKLEQEAKAT